MIFISINVLILNQKLSILMFNKSTCRLICVDLNISNAAFPCNSCDIEAFQRENLMISRFKSIFFDISSVNCLSFKVEIFENPSICLLKEMMSHRVHMTWNGFYQKCSILNALCNKMQWIEGFGVFRIEDSWHRHDRKMNKRWIHCSKTLVGIVFSFF